MFASTKVGEIGKLGIAALIAGLCSLPAAADTSDAERVEERLPTAQQPAPEAASPTPVSPAPGQPELADFPEFTLTRVTIEGMTVIPVERAERCARGIAGRRVNGIELAKLAECVTRILRDDGYFLSRAFVPPQEVLDGVLKLRVIEGYVGAVSVKGMDQVDGERQFMAALKERPTRLQTFERALLLLADRPGYRVAASQLLSDDRDPARYTLSLKITRLLLTSRIFADNRGTDGHGPDQLYAAVAWNSVFGEADRITGAIFTSPSSTRELLYADLNYFAGWCAGALWTEFGASFSRTEDGSIPKSVTLRSEADRFYGRAIVPVVRSREQSLWMSVAFDGREIEESDPLSIVTDESTRVVRASVAFNAIGPRSRTDFALEGSRGLDVLGASHNGDPRLTRPDARPQFTKLRLDAAHLQRLSEHWDVLVAAAGQLADGALVGGEEFGGGGARFGRGYDYSEITGDHGVAAAAEIRYTARNLLDALASLQVYAFADVAAVWNRSSDPLLEKADLSSAGFGVRVSPFPGLTATAEVAKPLSRVIAEEGDRDPRGFVSLSAAW